jgi:hypothetical protein
MDNYQKNWNEFWAEICLNPDGSVNLDQVQRELSDFREMMNSVSTVYDHLTKGRISKPNTCAKVVIQEVEALQQQEVDEAVKEVEDGVEGGSRPIKAYTAWEASQVAATKYLQPGDEVDEEMVNHFGGVVSPQYCTHHFTQVGEPQYERDGRFHYMTFGLFGERYLYLGILPPFKQPKR